MNIYDNVGKYTSIVSLIGILEVDEHVSMFSYIQALGLTMSSEHVCVLRLCV